MARITPYQQNQLAQQQVGTPGVDQTASNAFNQVAQSAGQLNATVQDQASKMFPEQSPIYQAEQKRAQLREYDRQLTTAARANRVQAVNMDFSKSLTDLTTGLQLQHNFDTTGIGDEFTDKSKTMIDSHLSQLSDPLDKQELQKALNETATGYQDRLQRWAEGRQVPIMEKNLSDTETSFVQAAGNPNQSIADLQQTFQKFSQNNAWQYKFLGKSPNKVGEAAIKQYLSAVVLNSGQNAPAALEQGIKDAEQTGMVKPSTLLTFQNEQKAIAAQIAQGEYARERVAHHGAKINAYNTILEDTVLPDGTKSGDYRDASPQAYNKALADPGLAPEDRLAIKKLQLEASQQKITTEEDVQTLQDETNITKHTAELNSNIEYLSSAIDKQYTQLIKTSQSGNAKTTQGEAIKLRQLVDQYTDMHKNLGVVRSGLQNRELKNLFQFTQASADRRFQEVSSLLNGFDKLPDVAREKSARAGLYSAVSPKMVFPDATKQNLYNYFYRAAFDNGVKNRGLQSGDMETIAHDPKKAAAYARILHSTAYQAMQKWGLNP